MRRPPVSSMRFGLVAAALLCAVAAAASSCSSKPSSTATGSGGKGGAGASVSSSTGSGGVSTSTSSGSGGASTSSGGPLTGAVQWTGVIDSPEPGGAYAIAAVPGGGVAIVGQQDDAVSQAGVIVARYDDGGAVVWSQEYMDSGLGQGLGVAVAPPDALQQSFSSPMLLVVGSTDGSLTFGSVPPIGSGNGAESFVAGVGIDQTVVFADDLGFPSPSNATATAYHATLDSAITVGETPDGLFVNAVGAASWTKQYVALATDGGPTYADAEAVAVDSQGRVLVGGTYSGTLPFQPSVVSSGSFNGYVVKLVVSPTGVTSASLLLDVGEPPFGASITAIAEGKNDDLWVAGTYHGQVTLGGVVLQTQALSSGFVARVDPQGKVALAVGFTNLGSDLSITGIAVDPAGDVVVSGWANEAVDFDGHSLVVGSGGAFVVKLHGASGAFAWSKAIAPTGVFPAKFTAVTTDAMSNVFVAGEIQGDVTFDGKPVHGSADVGGNVFVAKLAP